METEVRTQGVPDYPKAGIAGMKLELQATDWQELLSTLSTKCSSSAFNNKIQDIEERYVPVNSAHQGKLKPMWISHKALKFIGSTKITCIKLVQKQIG